MYGHWFIDPSQMERGSIREIDYALRPDGNDYDIDGNFDSVNLLPDIGLVLLYVFLLYSVAWVLTKYSVKRSTTGNPTKSGCFNYYIASNIFAIIIISWFFHDCLEGGETCSFDRWCHEEINGSAVSSKIYYRLYNEDCPDYAVWLEYMYHDENHNENCENTEYGCCEIWDPQRCSTVLENDETYSIYQYMMEKNISHWTLEVEKLDEAGKSCPTIEDIIYDVSVEHDYHFKFPYLISFGIFIVLTALLTILRLCCHKMKEKEPYIPTDYGPLDSDQTKIQGSV